MREHQELVFISQNGMVQRTGVRGISKQGRPAQGVRVMNLRDDDVVSAVALVVEESADTAASVAEGLEEASADGSTTAPAEHPATDGGDATELEGADARRGPPTARPTGPATGTSRKPDFGPAAASASIAGPGKGGGPSID